jgi:hypothetical protein
MTITRLPPHTWRVRWWDFDGHHDYIGRHQHRRKKPLPPIERTRDFYSREQAQKFAASLRREDGAEILVQLVPRQRERRARPLQPLLPGAWPLQERHDK